MKNAIGAKCAQNWAHQALGDNVIHKVKWQAISYLMSSMAKLTCTSMPTNSSIYQQLLFYKITSKQPIFILNGEVIWQATNSF